MSHATIYNQMVVNRQSAADTLDQLFGALADATRRDILARVMDADASVSELAAHYDMSFAAVQKHVAVLERARLVTKRKDGRAQRVAGNPDALRRATRLLARVRATLARTRRPPGRAVRHFIRRRFACQSSTFARTPRS